jgi:hypothetical protein
MTRAYAGIDVSLFSRTESEQARSDGHLVNVYVNLYECQRASASQHRGSRGEASALGRSKELIRAFGEIPSSVAKGVAACARCDGIQGTPLDVAHTIAQLGSDR